MIVSLRHKRYIFAAAAAAVALVVRDRREDLEIGRLVVVMGIDVGMGPS